MHQGNTVLINKNMTIVNPLHLVSTSGGTLAIFLFSPTGNDSWAFFQKRV
jgi:hypothetical protein